MTQQQDDMLHYYESSLNGVVFRWMTGESLVEVGGFRIGDDRFWRVHVFHAYELASIQESDPTEIFAARCEQWLAQQLEVERILAERFSPDPSTLP